MSLSEPVNICAEVSTSFDDESIVEVRTTCIIHVNNHRSIFQPMDLEDAGGVEQASNVTKVIITIG